MSRKLVELPKIQIAGIDKPVIAMLGGMGAGGTRWPLVSVVANRGWTGNISFVALDRIVGKEIGREISQYDAVQYEIEKSRSLSGGKGAISMNFMVALQGSYQISVKAAADAKIDAMVFGAGLPLNAPELVGDSYQGSLVVIVSSGRVLEMICKRWQKYDRVPDAVILEGPLAGGHLGFKPEQIGDPAFSLENLLPEVKKVADDWGGIPVIAAGGLWDNKDVREIINAGADGFQVATRFIGADECTFSPRAKQNAVDCCPEDIIIADKPDGSPAGMPFRIDLNSIGYEKAVCGEKCTICRWKYLTPKGNPCAALEGRAFCLCQSLLDVAGVTDSGHDIYTVGTNAYRIDHICPADEVVDAYMGITK